MRLGIDLDNTIINYDQLFALLAREQKLLPPQIRLTKQAIRDYLRAQNREDRWTELQGIAYGSRIHDAVPFEGFEKFLSRCNAARVEWWIISHRTRWPYLGVPVDLHQAARQWLLGRGFLSEAEPDRLQLEVSRDAKLRCIREKQCDTFIDDLPELLCDPMFPENVRRILFDPGNHNPVRAEYERASSWTEVAVLLNI